MHQRNNPIGILWRTAALLLLAAPAAHAQQWLVNSVINNQVVETAICDSALKKHQPLPSICSKYPKYSGRMPTQGKATPTAKTATNAKASVASLKFTPVAGDETVQKLADSLGSDAQQRQQILQLANAGRQLFEQKYAGRGWNNNVAGAMAFFIIATSTIQTDREPDVAAQENLFASLGTTLSQSPEFARISNKDKAALYNALLACAGLPLVFYADGRQQNNAAEVAKAREMSAEFSRKLLNMEPATAAAMLQ